MRIIPNIVAQGLRDLLHCASEVSGYRIRESSSISALRLSLEELCLLRMMVQRVLINATSTSNLQSKR